MKSFSRSILAQSLIAGAAALAFMMAGATVVRAQTVIGADGPRGDDCFTDGCHAGNGDDGQPASSDGNSATAIGGNGGGGGIAYSAGGIDGVGGNGGNAAATSSVISNGSSKAVSTATASGGNSGPGAIYDIGTIVGGSASATSHATANGSGDAASFATANGGGAGNWAANNGSAFASSIAVAKGSGGASASAIASLSGLNSGAEVSSYAETAEGGLAQADSQLGLGFFEASGVSAAAKTTYNGVSAESTLEAFGGSLEAIAQGGSGQFPDNPGVSAFIFSTALPNAAYATSLIGSASKVADALLGPGHIIFGTTILGENGDGSSTFDFSFRGDLLLGDVDDDRVTDLGFFAGPVHLTLDNPGVFVLGAAVPEPSTWAMLLVGFAGVSFASYRKTRGARGA